MDPLTSFSRTFHALLTADKADYDQMSSSLDSSGYVCNLTLKYRVGLFVLHIHMTILYYVFVCVSQTVPGLNVSFANLLFLRHILQHCILRVVNLPQSLTCNLIKEISGRSGGVPRRFEGCAFDPTHTGTKPGLQHTGSGDSYRTLCLCTCWSVL